MKKRILSLLIAIVMVVGLLPTVALADGGSGLTVGFKVKMNPKRENSYEDHYYDGETLDVELRDITSAYIKPYIEGVKPSDRIPWREHEYYTFTLHDIRDKNIADDENDKQNSGTFGVERIYNRANLGNTVPSNIVANMLIDERLGDNYYQIVVRKYKSGSSGEEDCDPNKRIGQPVVANLHVRMTWSKYELVDLESNYWTDKTYEKVIDSDLDEIYDSAEDLIAKELGDYTETYGWDEYENNWLDYIHVSWDMKDGTFSTDPGAKNTLTWTADPKAADTKNEWEWPNCKLSGDITFQNPFAVRFWDGEEPIDTVYVKNNNCLEQLPDMTEMDKKFLGWKTADGSPFTSETTVTSNIDVYAQWEGDDFNGIPGFIPGIIAGGASQMQHFVDVTSMEYYYDAVQWAADSGIATGTSSLLFSPDKPCTRAQAVTFLWRALGCPAAEKAANFTDVKFGSYYADAVAWAVENGVTVGTSATTFSPDAPCTRAQIVTFLYRAIGEKSTVDAGFSDVPANAYYADAVNWAAQYGITGGTGANRFSPDMTCTRAQIVTFLYRAN